MTSNNVIQFPKENKNIKKLISIDEINDSVEQMELYHIQETVNNIVPIMFAQMEVGGFNIDQIGEESVVKEGGFLVEAIRSFLCSHYGIYHPFQRIVEKIFVPDPSEGEGAYKIADILEELDLREDLEDEE